MEKLNKKDLLKTVHSWNIKKDPEYRGFRCASCQNYLRKAWHIWFNSDHYQCEIHLCRRCYQKI